MKPVDFLESLGFTKETIEIGGKPTVWYCNPDLINESTKKPEAIFQEGTFETRGLDYIIKVITYTAKNNGWRNGRIEEKQRMVEETERLLKSAVRKLKKSC